jgi:eukaryotic-like serine/threonine-protein kinase
MAGPANWARVQEVFAGALAVSPDQRAAYLTDACADDRALRQQVELLLDSHDQARSFLETPVIRPADASPATLHLEGHRMGGYEFVGRLGAGGMGEVYRARDTKLGRDVAIKILPPVFTRDRERLARFEREARVLAALNHPNIGAIYGLEESVGDAGAPQSPALVLELVEGDTLADRLAPQRGLPVADVLRIAAQIAEALDAAHAKGIVHRDLKPANIKITPGGQVKVLDFGLAKAIAL